MFFVNCFCEIYFQKVWFIPCPHPVCGPNNSRTFFLLLSALCLGAVSKYRFFETTCKNTLQSADNGYGALNTRVALFWTFILLYQEVGFISRVPTYFDQYVQKVARWLEWCSAVTQFYSERHEFGLFVAASHAFIYCASFSIKLLTAKCCYRSVSSAAIN
jgi:hypothetical protein